MGSQGLLRHEVWFHEAFRGAARILPRVRRRVLRVVAGGMREVFAPHPVRRPGGLHRGIERGRPGQEPARGQAGGRRARLPHPRRLVDGQEDQHQSAEVGEDRAVRHPGLFTRGGAEPARHRLPGVRLGGRREGRCPQAKECFREPTMPLPPRCPSLRRNNQSMATTPKMEAAEVARASPPCFRGSTRRRFKATSTS